MEIKNKNYDNNNKGALWIKEKNELKYMNGYLVYKGERINITGVRTKEKPVGLLEIMWLTQAAKNAIGIDKMASAKSSILSGAPSPPILNQNRNVNPSKIRATFNDQTAILAYVLRKLVLLDVASKNILKR